MKTLSLTISLFLFLITSGFAQLNQISGYITNAQNGNPVVNKAVLISASGNFGFSFSDTVYTAANGFYTVTMAFPYYQFDTADIAVKVINCNADTLYAFATTLSPVITNNFVVCETCHAGFSVVPEPVIPHAYTFVNASSSPTPMYFFWNFGDGSPVSSVYSPSHTFTIPGPHHVVLILGPDTLISPCGDSISVDVEDPIVFYWDTVHACPGTITASLIAKNFVSVQGMSLKTTFNPSWLTFLGMTYHNTGILLSNLTFTAGNGYLNIVWHSFTPITLSNDTLFKFDFNFSCNQSSLSFDTNSNVLGPNGYFARALVNGFVDCCTSLGQPDNQASLVDMFPNPVNETLFFSQEVSKVSIADLSGRLVFSEVHSKEIRLNELKPGMYFVNYTYNNKSYSRKLIVE
ncbi:MAG: T9SS type A sorting domain-containing protein [Bacteroidota bacterium]